ncbi:MAG: hypothetical protein HQK77_18110 [Desulfobacterales bacterium]|nr:hypothetical protein [Desulfobacterales bacterium]
MQNPFRDRIVPDPWHPSEIDVQEIHEDIYNICKEALATVRKHKQSSSVLIFGEAGSGKTHLLSRFKTPLSLLSSSHVLISIRMQTTRNRIWRHIQKTMIDNLSKKIDCQWSQLELVLYSHLFLQLDKQGIHRISSKTQLKKLFNSLAEELDLSYNFCRILEHIVQRNHLRAAISWLKGYSLPEAEQKALELISEDTNNSNEEEIARDRVLEICRFITSLLPIVFCFDQLEALQHEPGDTSGLFGFGQAVRFLYDHTEHVLFISCIQSFFVYYLKQHMMEPDFAALSIQQGTLNPLTLDQVMLIIQARLHTVNHLPWNIHDLLIAFQNDLKNFIGTNGRTAREALGFCADLFDSWEKGVRINTGRLQAEQSNEHFLNQETKQRLENAQMQVSYEQTDEIIGNYLYRLIHIFYDQCAEQDKFQKKDIELCMESNNQLIGISLCNQEDMISLSARFKRLDQLIQKNIYHSVVIIRHHDLTISDSAKKTKAYEQVLQQHPIVRFIFPSNEILAAVSVYGSMIFDAKSGDLVNSWIALTEKDVITWMQKHIDPLTLNFLKNVIEGNG